MSLLLNDPFFSPFTGLLGGFGPSLGGFGTGYGGGLLTGPGQQQQGAGQQQRGTLSTALMPIDDRQLLDFSRMAADPLPIDVEEKENEFMVRVHQREAGLRKKDLRVDIDNGALTIRGEREKKEGEEKGGHFRREYRSVFRSMALPENVDQDKVEARYEGNMLVVHLPKKPGSEGHRRSIQIGGESGGQQLGQGQTSGVGAGTRAQAQGQTTQAQGTPMTQ